MKDETCQHTSPGVRSAVFSSSSTEVPVAFHSDRALGQTHDLVFFLRVFGTVSDRVVKGARGEWMWDSSGELLIFSCDSRPLSLRLLEKLHINNSLQQAASKGERFHILFCVKRLSLIFLGRAR